MAWALMASVSWAISERAASSAQSRSFAGRPGLAANAARAAPFTVRRMPMIVDTSTVHLRAASAWVISPEAIYKKISHFVSALSTRGRRRRDPLVSWATACSSRSDRGACQGWFVSRWILRGEVRRRTLPIAAVVATAGGRGDNSPGGVGDRVRLSTLELDVSLEQAVLRVRRKIGVPDVIQLQGGHRRGGGLLDRL